MISKSKIYIFILFTVMFINIYISIPLIVLSFLKKDSSVKVTIPLFLSILAYYFIPGVDFDLYRHFTSYDFFNNGYELEYSRDFLLEILFIIGGFIGLDKHFLPMLSCFVLYFFWMATLNLKKDNVNRNYYAVVVIYLLTIPIILYSGLRFGMGLALGIYSLYLLDNSNVKKGTVFIILAAMTHFSMVIIPFVVCSQIILSKFMLMKNRRQIVTYLVFCLIFSFNIELFIDQIIEFVGLINHGIFGWNFITVDSYFTGSYGLERLDSLNTTGKFFTQLKQYSLILLLVTYVLCYKLYPKKPLDIWFVVLVCLCIIVINFSTIYGRFSQLALMLLVYDFSEKKFIENKKGLVIVFMLMFNLLLSRLLEVNNNFNYFSDSYSSQYFMSYFSLLYEAFKI
ncbi:EpsG-like putative glucosyltransferase [Vibrio crassostreae]|uniref:EpsG family protein n=1 Tax=Vibrio crassostreae TaxID=246167 RepID=UPI000F479397|nr:EpsG family protein [Vibrio crassostreae]ROO66103.1 EpsG-like putative glucosyltransferase [Vibrio crassostreae]ROP03210.1 EpsG-like putative glucosyltransferase [Vibrio crassostreae]ROQ72024.1 EpsG-like putative glucosyltransferase [Vibrio crassostreae]ROR77633.1 EpsG-like putative glucosyltransferase [Vibrio crassostreae]RPE88050.1 EpsG-like putative glucosyltransferase [Vibrio crassostreae]